jgi:hypothetical protein
MELRLQGLEKRYVEVGTEQRRDGRIGQLTGDNSLLGGTSLTVIAVNLKDGLLIGDEHDELRGGVSQIGRS